MADDPSSREIPVDPQPVKPRPAKPASDPPVLGYATPAQSFETVTIARYTNISEAELAMNALSAAGIHAHVIDKNSEMLGMYVGGNDVKVLVFKSDEARASEILKQATGDDQEPAENETPEPLDDEGKPLPLQIVGRFDSPRLLRDAATVLGSANIRSYPPNLVPRADRPPGLGKRFFLRVHPEDADQATSILEQAEEEASEENEYRCPKCSSWRVYPIGGLLHDVGMALGWIPGPSEGFECLSCKCRGTTREFTPAR